MTSHSILVPTRVNEQRRHPRVQLNMPVRLRWPTPFGQLTESTQTLDVSRGGLLIHRREPCPVKSRLWVTFPFDRSDPLPQPETTARVVRVEQTPAGGNLVAIGFDAASEHAPDGRAAGFNRRRHPRIRLALPIRIRPSNSPWPEEAMTIDVSAEGLLFSTARLYAVDDTVRVSLPPGTIRSQWASLAEVPARVVRVAPRPGSAEQQVALTLLPSEKRWPPCPLAAR